MSELPRLASAVQRGIGGISNAVNDDGLGRTLV